MGRLAGINKIGNESGNIMLVSLMMVLTSSLLVMAMSRSATGSVRIQTLQETAGQIEIYQKSLKNLLESNYGQTKITAIDNCKTTPASCNSGSWIELNDKLVDSAGKVLMDTRDNQGFGLHFNSSQSQFCSEFDGVSRACPLRLKVFFRNLGTGPDVVLQFRIELISSTEFQSSQFAYMMNLKKFDMIF